MIHGLWLTFLSHTVCRVFGHVELHTPVIDPYSAYEQTGTSVWCLRCGHYEETDQ